MNTSDGRSWTDVPSDILSVIRSRLFAKDLVSFNSVCKTWRSAPFIPRLNDSSLTELIKYPSLLYFHGDKSSCYVYNPVFNNTYIVDIPELVNAQILFSKYGWLLVSRNDEIFFFQPLTKQRIDLPKLSEEEMAYSFNRMCFSCPPTSPDCVVFGIVDMIESEKDVYISFIRRGDDSWASINPENIRPTTSKLLHRTCRMRIPFRTSYNNPVFWNGEFYCLSQDGCLGVFDPNRSGDDKWRILSRPNPPLESADDQHNFLVEYNGDLVSVFVGRVGGSIKLFKLNRSSKFWNEIESLEDWMIFVSYRTSIGLSNKSQVAGMENKIYFPRFQGKDRSVFYSLSTGEFHSFEDGYRAEDLNNTKEFLNCTWIEPNFELFSSEELDWLIPNPVTHDFLLSNPKRDLIRSLSFKCTWISAEAGTKLESDAKQAVSMHPWIIFTNGEDGEMQNLFDLSTGCNYATKLQKFRGKFICCCQFEWLVILDRNSDDCFLLNPASMEKILLPQWEQSFSYSACLLTTSPDDPDCVVSFFGRYEDDHGDFGEFPEEGDAKVIYCKVGDCKWTKKATPTGPETRRFLCAASYKGKIYALARGGGNFVTIELDPTFTITKLGVVPGKMMRGSMTVQMSLVASSSDLLLVRAGIHGDPVTPKPTIYQSISVYKMNFEIMAWEEVKNLGDCTLFNSWCGSCCTRESTFKGNKIYFLESINLYTYDLQDLSLSVSSPFPLLENPIDGELIMCRY